MSKYYLIKTDLPPMKLGKAKKGNDYAFVIDSVAMLSTTELMDIITDIQVSCKEYSEEPKENSYYCKLINILKEGGAE